MLSYTEDGDRTIYDLFLNAVNAKKFLADIGQFYSPGNPLVITFQNTIDGKSKKFLIENDYLDGLISKPWVLIHRLLAGKSKDLSGIGMISIPILKPTKHSATKNPYRLVVHHLPRPK
jgi:hypothetical protein